MKEFKHLEWALKAIKQQHPHVMTEEEGINHLKDRLFHGLWHNIHYAHYYLYDKPEPQYSQLVMAVRKTENETPGSGEVMAKSAVADLDSQLKIASSDPPYEVITQQIAYLLSEVTNQNANNSNGQNGPRHNNGNGKFSNTKTQRPKKERNDMTCWGCRGTGHGWRECSTPQQGNNLPF